MQIKIGKGVRFDRISEGIIVFLGILPELSQNFLRRKE
jgi:hypothetical protein